MCAKKARPAIVIHGGAGTISPSSMTEKKENEYKIALKEALLAGEKELNAGRSAMAAVEAAIISLEDCPLFNAGRGSVFTHTKTHEMEASIMDGKTLNGGAVANISSVKNPIALARAVMQHTKHVYLAGPEALELAKQHSLPIMPDEYFHTRFREKQWIRANKLNVVSLDHNDALSDKKYGTVGAVALDRNGNVAAATSTGGMTNKQYGRIGDSSILGAGNYANNNTCAISCTGHGEFFIRTSAAHDVSCLMDYKGLTLEEASLEVLQKLKDIGGRGGMIGIAKNGDITMNFNTKGMYRGYKIVGEEEIVAIYR